jgi:hypothetical protein
MHCPVSHLVPMSSRWTPPKHADRGADRQNQRRFRGSVSQSNVARDEHNLMVTA